MTRTTLAVELARPVIRGYLPIEHAEAALAVAILKRIPGISEGSGSFDEKLAVDCHILNLNLHKLQLQRDIVANQISRVVQPLISKRESRGRIRAEAHDINAETGHTFDDVEVEDILIRELLKARSRAGVLAPTPLRRPRRYHGG